MFGCLPQYRQHLHNQNPHSSQDAGGHSLLFAFDFTTLVIPAKRALLAVGDLRRIALTLAARTLSSLTLVIITLALLVIGVGGVDLRLDGDLSLLLEEIGSLGDNTLSNQLLEVAIERRVSLFDMKLERSESVPGSILAESIESTSIRTSSAFVQCISSSFSQGSVMTAFRPEDIDLLPGLVSSLTDGLAEELPTEDSFRVFFAMLDDCKNVSYLNRSKD